MGRFKTRWQIINFGKNLYNYFAQAKVPMSSSRPWTGAWTSWPSLWATSPTSTPSPTQRTASTHWRSSSRLAGKGGKMVRGEAYKRSLELRLYYVFHNALALFHEYLSGNQSCRSPPLLFCQMINNWIKFTVVIKYSHLLVIWSYVIWCSVYMSLPQGLSLLPF